MTLVIGERKCNTTLSFSYCLSSASWKQHLMDSLTGAVRLSQERLERVEPVLIT